MYGKVIKCHSRLNMYKWLIIIIFLLGAIRTYGQGDNQIIIKGKLKDSSNREILGLRTFSVRIDSVKLIVFQTLNDGSFNIKINPPLHKNTISISLNNYKTKSVILNALSNKEINLGDILLSLKPLNLHEVIIKEKQKSKDTLDFVMRDSLFKSFNMTEYALKKVPGITIVNNEVFYNGKRVNAVNVNGKKFLFNENEFMLNNLPAYAIDKVQIINKSTDNSNKFDPEVNVVLKKNSSSGYISRLLGGYGTAHRQTTNTLISKISPNDQIAVSVKSNNINNPDLFNGVNDIQSLPGLNNDLEVKSIFRKSLKRVDFDALFNYTNNNLYSSQNTQRTDINKDTLIKSNYNNTSKTQTKSYTIDDGFEYKINPSNTLYFRQNIKFQHEDSFNNTVYDDLTHASNTSQLMSVLDNRNRTFNISDKLTYNYKGKHGRSSNDYLSFSFEHELFIQRKNNQYQTNNISTPEIDSASFYITNIYNNSYKFNSNYTGNFSNGYTLNIKADNSISILKQAIPSPSVNTSFKYSQTINDLSANINKYGKRFDFQVEAGFLNYLVSEHSSNIKTSYIKFLPSVNYTYKFTEQNTIALDYNKKADFNTLQQLTLLANVNNTILPSVENYRIKPSITDNYSLTYSLTTPKLGIHINIGHQQKLNALSSNIVDPNSPVFVLQNIGTTQSDFLISRYEYNLLEALKLVLNINYNYSNFKSTLESSSKNITYDNNLGITYAKQNLEAVLSIGLNNNTSKFKISNDYNTYSLSTVSFNNTFKGTVFKNYRVLLLSRLFFNSGENTHNVATLLTTSQIGRNLLPDKNLDVFIRCENMFNSSFNRANSIQASYIQSSNMLMLGRYFLLGVQYKFNTIKR